MITTDVEEVRDLNLAKEIAEILHEHYPNHLWAVNIKGGLVHVKNYYISDKFGMAIHYKNISGDAAVRKKKIIRAGGEFLERAKMKRGKYEGLAVGKVEGIR